MQYSAVFLGAELLQELQTSDKMTAVAARSWVMQKTGRGFDAEAMYQLGWESEEDCPNWSGYLDLHVHILSDAELDKLERERRRQKGLPQRRPWEAPMFESARGRSSGNGRTTSFESRDG